MSSTPGNLDLGVIVVTYRSAADLEDCFKGLKELVESAAVTVVDAASPDDTAEAAHRLWPGIRVHRMQRNRGFAAAVNVGLTSVPGKYILILNADAATESAGVPRAMKWLDSHLEFALLGARLVGTDGRAQASRNDPPTLRAMARMYLLRDQREPGPIADVDGVLEARSIVGAAMLVRSDSVRKIGPLDESYFLYCEEVDWCVRIRESGARVGTFPSWTVVHAGGASTGTLDEPGDVFAHRSRYQFFLNHGGRPRAEAFRMILVAALPIASLAAAINCLIGRISPTVAGRRMASLAAAILSPRQRIPAC